MKTVCIYHSIDLDGWMSAAIVKHWYEKKYYPNTLYHGNVIVDPNEGLHSLTFLGWNYGDPIPNLSEYDEVIMCDVSFPLTDMLELDNKEFIWIDHHISAITKIDSFVKENMEFQDKTIADEVKIDGLRDTNFAACELTWQYFFPNQSMPEIVRLLGRYDCFGHKGTNEEKKVLEFQYGARQAISNYEEAYDYLLRSIHKSRISSTIEEDILMQGKSIYSYLCTEAKQIYKNGFEIKFEEEKWIYNPNNIIIHERKFICFNRERFNPINFGINYHKDGYDGAACFWYTNGMWNFSLYNDNGEVDCSVIAKEYGGGGHKGAAGFRIDNIKNIIK